jgi:hypothetical protein
LFYDAVSLCEWFLTFRTWVLRSFETSETTHQKTQRIIPENMSPHFAASLHVKSETDYSNPRSSFNVLSRDTGLHPRRIEPPVTSAVPWLRRLVAGLSPRRPGFDPRSVHVGFVVDKMTGFPRVLRFFPVSFISTVFHYNEKRKN